MSYNHRLKINMVPLQKRLDTAWTDQQYRLKQLDPSYSIASSDLHSVIYNFVTKYPEIADLTQSELCEYRQSLRPGYRWDSEKRQYNKMLKVKA